MEDRPLRIDYLDIARDCRTLGATVDDSSFKALFFRVADAITALVAERDELRESTSLTVDAVDRTADDGRPGEVQDTVPRAAAESDLERVSRQLKSCATALANAKSEREEWRQAYSKKSQRLDALLLKLDAKDVKIKSLSAARDEAQRGWEWTSQKLDEARQKLDEARRDREATEQAAEEMHAEIAQLTNSITAHKEAVATAEALLAEAANAKCAECQQRHATMTAVNECHDAADRITHAVAQILLAAVNQRGAQ